MISVKKAIHIMAKNVEILGKEEIPLENSNMRVLAKDIEVLIDVPPFDRAAMDGYAIKAEDTSKSSPQNPIYFEVIAEIGAGEVSKVNLNHYKSVKIATGAPMPQGSDAVVMEENVPKINSQIKLTQPVDFNQDVALQGEDLKKGEIILKKGHILSPNQLALVASSGHSKTKAIKKPKVGVIITGNELVDPTTHLEPGMIINSNKYALKGLIEDCMAVPYLSLGEDNLKTIISQLENNINKFDAVITTGGTAISRGDVVVEAVQELGEVLVHGVSVKPGKPFGFGLIEDKPVFMLSGYPVAAAVQFDILVREQILKMQGINLDIKLLECAAGSNVRSTQGKYNVIRGHLEDGTVYPIKTKAGINKSIIQSNCYILTDENTGKVRKGEKCQVLKYKELKIC